MTKIPIIGQHYVKEVPPSDNVCLYSLWLWLWWFGVGDVERREGGEEMEGGGERAGCFALQTYLDGNFTASGLRIFGLWRTELTSQ